MITETDNKTYGCTKVVVRSKVFINNLSKKYIFMPSFESESNLHSPEVWMLIGELTGYFAHNANRAIFHQPNDFEESLIVEVNGIYEEQGHEYYVELHDAIYSEDGHSTAIRVGSAEYEVSEERGVIDLETDELADEEEVMDIRLWLSQTRWQAKFSPYSVEAELQE